MRSFSYFLLLIGLLFSGCAFSQNKLQIPGEIISAQLNPAKTLMALSTADSLYVVELDGMKIRQRRGNLGTLLVVESIPAMNDDAVFLRMRKNHVQFYDGLSKRRMMAGAYFDFNEYPEDSIVLWKVEANTLSVIASGNNLIAPGHHGERVVTALNEVYSYESYGNIYWGSISGNLVSWDSNRTYSKQLRQSCKRIVVSPTDKIYAATFHSATANNVFNIRDYYSHESYLEMDSLESLPDDFCFSADGKLCALALKINDSTFNVRVFSMTGFQLTGTYEFESDGSIDKLGSLEFIRDNTQIAYLFRDGWHAIDMASGKEVETYGFDVSGIRYSDAWYANGQLVRTFPDLTTGIPDWDHFWIEKSGLDDMKTFTRREQSSMMELETGVGKSLMINNSILNLRGYTKSEIKFDSDRKHFMVESLNKIEYWNTMSHKKIWERQFEQEIRAFPGGRVGHMLVFEKNPNGYRMHFLEIEKNRMLSSAVIARDESEMSIEDCHCQISSDSTWVCVDDSRNIWEITENQYEPKPIQKLKDPIGDEIFAVAENSYYIRGLFDNKYWFSSINKSVEEVIYSGTESIQVASNGPLLCYWHSKGTTVHFLLSGIRNKLEFESAQIQDVDVGEDLSVLVRYNKYGKYYIDKYLGNELIFSVEHGGYGDHYFIHGKDEIIYWNEETGFASLLDEMKTMLPWTIQRPKSFLENFDVSPNGNYIIFGRALLDLREIRVQDLGLYESTRLLDDSKFPQRLKIYSKLYMGSTGFGLMKLIGPEDTVFSKTYVEGPKDGFFFANDKLEISPDLKWAVSYTKSLLGKTQTGPTLLWNLETMTGEVVLKAGTEVNGAYFREGQLHMYNAERDYSLELLSGKIRSKKTSTDYDPVPDESELGSKKFGLAYHQVQLLEAKQGKWEVIKPYYSREDLSNLQVYEPGKLLVAGSPAGMIYFWEQDGSGSPILTIKAHSAAIKQFELRGKYLYSLSENGELALFDLEKRKQLLTIVFLQKEKELKFLMITPEGYYRMDPDLVKYVHFARQGNIYPMGSNDLEYNRPDKVYEAIGKSSAVFLDDLRKSWVLRMKRQSVLAGDYRPAPILKLGRGAEPGSWTNKSAIDLKLHYSDSILPAQKLFVWVNGVPIGHSRGQLIVNGKKEMDLEQKIQLNNGENHVFAVAENSLGVRSSELSFDIFYKPEVQVQPRVYYVGVGVANYSDTTWRLKFSGNDVRDITDRLGYYSNTTVLDTLIDANASKANILAIRKKLLATSVDDVVIISFSGHGVKHEDSGFFFAPWDMDFDHPWKNGIDMEDISGLLEDIPARKRLLMLDACHSGEDLAFDYSGTLAAGVSESKPRGGKIVRLLDTSAAAGSKSLTLLKEMFTDLNAGSGAYMISASASSEFAFEGAKWKNGIFTYSFLKHFGYQDDLFTVKDLRNGIYKDVTELSGGMQNPTSRLENGYWNWEIELVPKRR